MSPIAPVKVIYSEYGGALVLVGQEAEPTALACGFISYQIDVRHLQRVSDDSSARTLYNKRAHLAVLREHDADVALCEIEWQARDGDVSRVFELVMPRRINTCGSGAYQHDVEVPARGGTAHQQTYPS